MLLAQNSQLHQFVYLAASFDSALACVRQFSTIVAAFRGLITSRVVFFHPLAEKSCNLDPTEVNPVHVSPS